MPLMPSGRNDKAESRQWALDRLGEPSHGKSCGLLLNSASQPAARKTRLAIVGRMDSSDNKPMPQRDDERDTEQSLVKPEKLIARAVLPPPPGLGNPTIIAR